MWGSNTPSSISRRVNLFCFRPRSQLRLAIDVVLIARAYSRDPSTQNSSVYNKSIRLKSIHSSGERLLAEVVLTVTCRITWHARSTPSAASGPRRQSSGSSSRSSLADVVTAKSYRIRVDVAVSQPLSFLIRLSNLTNLCRVPST